MKGVKFGGVFAACGFLLSLIFGLFSHTSILSVLLKALIFGLIFGGLGFGISIVFDTFLKDDSVGDFSSDASIGEGNPSVPQMAVSSKGQMVDITIQDEELPESESDNHFVVGDNHQMLHDSDFKKSEPETSEKSKSDGFVPLKNFETLKNLSGKESVSPEAVKSVPVSNDFGSSSFNNGIDTLPDMNNMVLEEESSESEESDGADTGFGQTTTVSHSSNREPPEIKDASLIAKAISSVLADENSL